MAATWLKAIGAQPDPKIAKSTEKTSESGLASVKHFVGHAETNKLSLSGSIRFCRLGGRFSTLKIEDFQTHLTPQPPKSKIQNPKSKIQNPKSTEKTSK